MLKIIKRKLHNLVSDPKFSEILTGSAWAIGARVIAMGFGLIISAVIARLYGAEIVGIVAVLNSFLTLTTIFTVLGTSTSILRLIPEHLTKYSPTSAFQVYRKTQYFVAFVSVLTGGLLFMASDFVADTIFSKSYLKFYFSVGAVFIFFKSLMLLNTQAVRGLRLIRVFAFMQLLPSLSNLSFLVLLTVFFYNQDNPIYTMFASMAITALAGAWIMDRKFKQKTAPEDVTRPISIKKILNISLPMLMAATMTLIIGETGVIMLGIFRSGEEVGYYAIAVKLSTLTNFFLNAVNSMAGPMFSELFHLEKMEELFYLAKKSAKLIFWTTTPILISFVIFGKSILRNVFGQEFAIAYPALVLLVIGQFVHAISGATGLFMNMTGNQNAFKNIVFIAAVTNIGINLVLTPKYGVCGTATAGMVSLIIWNIGTLFYIKLKFGKTTGYFPKIT